MTQVEHGSHGELIVSFELADPENSYPGHLAKTLNQIRDDPSSVSVEVGLPAKILRDGIIRENAIFRTAMEMVISATLAARGYAVVTEADPEGERFNKIYARPPIFDPGIALELGTVIEDNYDRMRNLHPDAKCNMPTILLPGSVS